MTQINIEDALERIGSTRQRDRREGLQDLKRILNSNKRNNQLRDVRDRGYHAIFDTLFRLAQNEKSNYLRYTSGSRSHAASMLSECASVLRLTIEAGVQEIREKTLCALIDHILDALPESDGHFCEPLATHYLRALVALLQYPPHAAHLLEPQCSQWLQVVRFCQTSLQAHIQSGEDSDSFSLPVPTRPGLRSDRPSRASSPSSLSGILTPVQKSFAGAESRRPAARNNHVINDLVTCLYYVLRVPHARVIEVAKSSLDVLSDFLEAIAPLSQPQGQEKAFACFSILLNVALTENLELGKLAYERCIRHTRRHWHPKAQDTLKDQMLACISLGIPLLDALVNEDDEVRQTKTELELLLDVLRQEYCKRHERDLLQQEDLEVCELWCERPSYPFTFPYSRIKCGTRRVEHAACLLFAIAQLYRVLYFLGVYAQNGREVESESASHPRKRQKVNGPLEAFFDEIIRSKGSEQVARTQVLAFITTGSAFGPQALYKMIEFATSLMSSESGSVAAWGMLTVALLAHHANSSLKEPMGSMWLQAWKIATQKLATPATCRLASYLTFSLIETGLVNPKTISESIETMLLSVELNGPISFNDYSTLLWAKIIEFRARLGPSTASDVALRVIRWISIRWQPSQVALYPVEPTSRSYTDAQAVLKLLRILLGSEGFAVQQDETEELGIAALGALRLLNIQPLLDFLLLHPEDQLGPWRKLPQPASQNFQWNLSDLQFQRLVSVLSESLHVEIISAKKAIAEGGHAVRNLSAEGVSAICALSLSSIWLSLLPRARQNPRLEKLQKDAVSLTTELADLTLRAARVETPLQGIIRTLGPFAKPGARDSSKPGDRLVEEAVQLATGAFNVEFWRSVRALQQDSDGGIDLIDVDNVSNSQPGRRTKSDAEEYPTDWLGHLTCPKSKDALLRLRLCLASCHRQFGTADSQILSPVPPIILDYILEQSPHDVLCCREFFKELLQSDLALNAEQIDRCLDYLGGDVLHCYEFERSEVAMGICLDFLYHLVSDWISSEDEVADLASQFYEWFTKVAVGKGLSSPHVHVSFSKVLQKVIAIRPDYARDLSLPPAHATLLKILESGQVLVKFSTGVEISEIFSYFVLKEHDAILDDVIEHLPLEIDWLEGTAVRIFILSNLASSWPTLIRRCLFALVEAPFLVHSVTSYASFCILRLTEQLNLGHPNELFRLFASQIIYSWLESRPLESLPYSIFDYATLKDLLKDIQDEVTAQVLMRGRDTEAHVLADVFSITWPELLNVAFGKSAAYAIARDAAISPDVDREAAHGVSRLTKLLGKEKYRQLITNKFPEILGTFFKIVDREDSVVKGFEKYDLHSIASNTYGEICSSGMSEAGLASSQQPSFKASCLADEIEYLCARSTYDAKSMWTPALYVYIFRGLINSIHDALGPLHSITVVQRIRILISMAGPTVLADYPLELTMHGLRPLLVKTYCAEDTMGIYRYLLTHGQVYLQKRPGFLIGIGVATLLSLRRFINTPQDSTTQESQHQTTMAKAEAFHTWIGDYLHRSENFEDCPDDWSVIIDAARRARSSGSAIAGCAESDLLKALLRDELGDQPFLDPAYRNLVLGMLCTDFNVPERPRDDIVYLDRDAVNYASAVWSSSLVTESSRAYRLWVARVLGRAYAASGHVVSDLTNETSLRLSSQKPAGSSRHLTSDSRLAIIQQLEKVLLSAKPHYVGVAESAIQDIVSHADEAESLRDCIDRLPENVLPAMLWSPYVVPSNATPNTSLGLEEAFLVVDRTLSDWSKHICIALITETGDIEFLKHLHSVVLQVDGLATDIFPHVVHLALLKDFDIANGSRKSLSVAIRTFFTKLNHDEIPFAKIVIETILYLRSQQIPRESSKAERAYWLDIDYHLAAEVAVQCKMYKTSLLFLEIKYSGATTGRSSRRSSQLRGEFPNTLLEVIFQNLSDRDSFYGLKQAPNLKAVMGQLEFENSGFKSLSFRGAEYDSEIQRYGEPRPETKDSLLKVLHELDLGGLSMSMFDHESNASAGTEDITFVTARKLELWDLAAPIEITNSSHELFRVFQDVHDAASFSEVKVCLERGFSNVFELATSKPRSTVFVHTTLSALATLTEIEDILSAEDVGSLEQTWSRMHHREQWMLTERFDRVQDILSCRKTLFSSLSKSRNLQNVVNVSPKAARAVEIQALLASSSLFRQHEALQKCLGNATLLNGLVEPSKTLGLLVDVAAQLEVSNVMWDQSEMVPSIQILRDLLTSADVETQTIPVARPVLLAKLGHRVSEARLEQPDKVIDNYLAPAIKQLRGNTEGQEAGQVYHEFAAFCDQQLQNSDNIEDMRRAQRLRDEKEKEVHDLDRMLQSAGSQSRERETLKNLLGRAKQWLELDDREYSRLRDERQVLLQRSLENYLLCLQACESYQNDSLRFSALWLEHSDNETANAAVSKLLKQVPSRKFATLMNQWTSRLLETDNEFQTLLKALVYQICVDHPYHGMYHIFASSKSKGGKDQVALSRHTAANNIVARLKANKKVGAVWLAVHNTNINFVRFAAEKADDGSMKQGLRLQLRKSPNGQKLENDTKTLKVPPPTMKVALRSDCDYSQIPVIQRYQSEFTIASGISMPKILTVIASNGRKYKQLFKSGNDDLRQDAIMEQVFEQVSDLLRSQRETRLRNLGIRTYRVLPLTATAGVIEFVSNTMPLHDYLIPAHQRYFPNDYKNNMCRKTIHDVQSKPNEQRLRVFQQVCEKFHPVLRHFFMERFENPDDWYTKRLAYTRSTAAISILGHILGLGDRHGHNILLDETSGEVIHIDLGIAFEQGRVLPVPEVVPFRLTRDVVDGMGITKTEGLFRRCCEFTLDALRKEAYSIMTILDVLRYDPLYSWSLSPLRLKRLQEDQEAELGVSVAPGASRQQEKKDEQGEADRALTVVSKKLSKTLSVTATVNELIQQATDERNLALLYCGWAAYA